MGLDQYKKNIQYRLQQLLGLKTYLFWFARFKIHTFRWDKNEKDFFYFVNLLSSKSNVLDIGSNIGVTTYHLAKKVNQGKVFSFEPVPPNYETLQRIKKHYDLSNVELYDVAVGDENKIVEMVMPEVQQVQMQGLSHVVHEDLTEFNEGKRFTASLVTLDNLNELSDIPIEGIKLDVENFEYFVLKGGQDLIQKNQPIIYTELWENENRTKCFEFLLDLKYSIKVLNGKGLKDYNPNVDKTQNFFLLPPTY